MGYQDAHIPSSELDQSLLDLPLFGGISKSEAPCTQDKISDKVDTILNLKRKEYPLPIDDIYYENTHNEKCPVTFLGFDTTQDPGVYVACIKIEFKKTMPLRVHFSVDVDDYIKIEKYPLGTTRDRYVGIDLNNDQLREIVSYLSGTKYWEYFSKGGGLDISNNVRKMGDITLENTTYKNVEVSPYYQQYFVEFQLGRTHYKVRMNPKNNKKIQQIFRKLGENSYEEAQNLGTKELYKIISLTNHVESQIS